MASAGLVHPPVKTYGRFNKGKKTIAMTTQEPETGRTKWETTPKERKARVGTHRPESRPAYQAEARPDTEELASPQTQCVSIVQSVFGPGKSIGSEEDERRGDENVLCHPSLHPNRLRANSTLFQYRFPCRLQRRSMASR
jgi:hypothetical protein